MSWIGKSVIALFCFVPIMIGIPFFERHFKVHPQVNAVWYFAATAVGIFGASVFSGMTRVQDFGFRWSVAAVALIGLVLGTALNGLVFQAASEAPSPALPFAVVNSATAVTFLVALVLAKVLPEYFTAPDFSARHFAGILLTAAGVILLSTK